MWKRRAFGGPRGRADETERGGRREVLGGCGVAGGRMPSTNCTGGTSRRRLAPQAGLEPATLGLTASRGAAHLLTPGTPPKVWLCRGPPLLLPGLPLAPECGLDRLAQILARMIALVLVKRPIAANRLRVDLVPELPSPAHLDGSSNRWGSRAAGRAFAPQPSREPDVGAAEGFEVLGRQAGPGDCHRRKSFDISAW
jgi:hypothetical protein